MILACPRARAHPHTKPVPHTHRSIPSHTTCACSAQLASTFVTHAVTCVYVLVCLTYMHMHPCADSLWQAYFSYADLRGATLLDCDIGEAPLLNGQTKGIFAMVLDTEGVVYTGGVDANVWIWEANQLVRTNGNHRSFRVRATLNSCVVMFAAQPRAMFGHTASVCALALGNGFVFSGSADRTVRVWTPKAHQVSREWLKSAAPVAMVRVVRLCVHAGREGVGRSPRCR